MKGWIVDKSVASRLNRPDVAAQIVDADGPLFLCEIGLLEQLYSTRSADDYDRVAATLRASFVILAPPSDLLSRALALQHDLAHHQGLWHRRPIPDLLIAITAAHHDVGVVHIDNDFDLIVQVLPIKTWKLTQPT